MAAGWQIQPRIDLPHARPSKFEDIGRVDGLAALPLFSLDASNLALVWDVGRPMLPFPSGRDALERFLRAQGSEAPWHVGWLSATPPEQDVVLLRLKAEGVAVVVERQIRITRHTSRGEARYSLARLHLMPRDASLWVDGDGGISTAQARGSP
jgi:hypothetical protein